ncbi:MAG: diaminopimelate decarboxylase [Bacteroidetes bacterium]|nr:diaminopimelate decarboxylase [Rhodothermia bacterium]MCS7154214.1 diaminopimelate decarboxylase [Bacteroidota bacterium]MCX7906750.1 diaminopimelate decarboxylase [Bacteroidota bacterium]MDW8136970.1 diaminopimelate decarboxylase [Bacteroidota bacterium]MDW8285159.1 diaminopimelate decarboxylase [Bacteroidota bacterium]
MSAHPPIAPDRLLEAAELWGTPLYVYDEATIRARCRQLREVFSALPHRLLYALKANYNPHLLRIIRREGFGFDAVSLGEVELLQRALGVGPEEVLFTPNMLSDAEMQEAVARGLLLNIGELSRLERFAARYPGRSVALRINPARGAGHHAYVVTAGENAKFGIPLEDLPQAQEIAQAGGLRIVGLHQHIGSGIPDLRAFGEAMRILLELAPHFPDLQWLDFGGGLPIPYRPDERPLDWAEAERHLIGPLKEFLARSGRPLRFYFEPGRYVVAEAGLLLVRVTALKRVGKRRYVGTDSGFHHLIRPVLYGSYHHIVNLSNPEGPLNVYTVTGNLCESGDVFAHDRPMPEVRIGDVLAILDAGAYGLSMASTYNLREFPAEVLFTAEGRFRCIRPRPSREALVAAILRDTAFKPEGCDAAELEP